MTARTPPLTEVTDRDSPWPFTVQARIIAVPAAPVRLAIGVLVVLALEGATIICMLANAPPYILVR